jgi:hypothetical protein
MYRRKEVERPATGEIVGKKEKSEGVEVWRAKGRIERGLVDEALRAGM